MLEVDERGHHLQPVLVERARVGAADELDRLRLEVVVDRLQLGEDLLHVLVLSVVEENWKGISSEFLDLLTGMEIRLIVAE